VLDVQPHYDREFQCIGPDCEDHCCSHWNVAIDRATYEKYRSTPGLRPLVDQHVEISDPHADSNYARIKLSPPAQICPFFTAERLCSIHQRYGLSYLTPTCVNYPRALQGCAAMTRPPFFLSCPEASRLVLFQPDLVPFERDPADDRPDYRRFLRMAHQPLKQHPKAQQKHFTDAQSFSLLLIQDRAYPLWQRLFLLGMFSKRMTETLEQNPNLVPKLLGEFAAIVRQQRLRSEMDGIPLQTAAQLGVIIEVARRLETESHGSARVQECIRDFIQGIRYDRQSPVETLAPAYAEAYQQYYQPFMEKHPFVMENYLSNYVFWTHFPRGTMSSDGPNNPLAAYFRMCLKYAVVKGLLIGMAGHYRADFAAEHVVKLVQCFSKAAEHSLRFLRGLNQNFATASGMALLLKN